MTRSSRMSEKVEQYLQLRRGLGYKLQTEGKLLSSLPRSPTQPITMVP